MLLIKDLTSLYVAPFSAVPCCPYALIPMGLCLAAERCCFRFGELNGPAAGLGSDHRGLRAAGGVNFGTALDVEVGRCGDLFGASDPGPAWICDVDFWAGDLVFDCCERDVGFVGQAGRASARLNDAITSRRNLAYLPTPDKNIEVGIMPPYEMSSLPEREPFAVGLNTTLTMQLPPSSESGDETTQLSVSEKSPFTRGVAICILE
jgi:hypothetical protein